MKRGIKYSLLVIGFLGVVFFSCKKKEYTPLYFGYDYFPNRLGHYVIYECDSIIFNPFSKNSPQFDTFKYQIKEVIDSLFTDNEGRTAMRIVRYKKSDTSKLQWSNILVPEKVWTGNLLSTMAQRQEDNYKYIKMIFPVSLNATWNGNALNSFRSWNYTYTTLNVPATINGTTFDSTLTVMQANQSSFLSYQYYYEQYATGVGLVYKEVIDYSDTSFISIPPPVTSANAGTILYTETYLSSGN